jgi:hypothetical protein
MPRILKVFCIATFSALALDWAFALVSYLFPSAQAASQSAGDNVVYLDQG